MSEIRCAHCGNDLTIHTEEGSAWWGCCSCGTISRNFSSRAAAEAHARGHLEAMLERLYEKGGHFSGDDFHGTFIELPSKGIWRFINIKELRAVVEAALKEVEG